MKHNTFYHSSAKMNIQTEREIASVDYCGDGDESYSLDQQGIPSKTLQEDAHRRMTMMTLSNSASTLGSGASSVTLDSALDSTGSFSSPSNAGSTVPRRKTSKALFKEKKKKKKKNVGLLDSSERFKSEKTTTSAVPLSSYYTSISRGGWPQLLSPQAPEKSSSFIGDEETTLPNDEINTAIEGTLSSSERFKSEMGISSHSAPPLSSWNQSPAMPSRLHLVSSTPSISRTKQREAVKRIPARSGSKNSTISWQRSNQKMPIVFCDDGLNPSERFKSERYASTSSTHRSLSFSSQGTDDRHYILPSTTHTTTTTASPFAGSLDSSERFKSERTFKDSLDSSERFASERNACSISALPPPLPPLPTLPPTTFSKFPIPTCLPLKKPMRQQSAGNKGPIPSTSCTSLTKPVRQQFSANKNPIPATISPSFIKPVRQHSWAGKGIPTSSKESPSAGYFENDNETCLVPLSDGPPRKLKELRRPGSSRRRQNHKNNCKMPYRKKSCEDSDRANNNNNNNGSNNVDTMASPPPKKMSEPIPQQQHDDEGTTTSNIICRDGGCSKKSSSTFLPPVLDDTIFSCNELVHKQ